jgi:hypothetical protein
MQDRVNEPTREEAAHMELEKPWLDSKCFSWFGRKEGSEVTGGR